jgi:hypothetical protein
MYTDNSLSLLLDNYWNLYEGILPGDAGSERVNVSPFESACILKADMDKAIESLNGNGHWNKCVVGMDALFHDGMDPRDLFNWEPSYRRGLNKWQMAVMKHHFKLWSVVYIDLHEYALSMVSRSMMLRYLNNGVADVKRDYVQKRSKGT